MNDIRNKLRIEENLIENDLHFYFRCFSMDRQVRYLPKHRRKHKINWKV